MRLLDKSDTTLAVALVAGTLVIFERPLRFVIDIARDVEVRYDIDLLPGLAVLASAFAFHQYRKKQLAKSLALTAASEAAKERLRAAELDRLVAFGAALAGAREMKDVTQLFWRYMPAFSRDREVWLRTRTDDGWDATHRRFDHFDKMARAALSAPLHGDAKSDGLIIEGEVCFALVGGDLPVGVVGVRNEPPLSITERRAIGAAVSILASAIRNVQLLAETRESSLRDQLTGCFNRAYAVETLGSELHRAKRSGRPLSVMMFDIDRFKTINDDRGHLAGDSVLAAMAGQAARTLRASDIKCRWGGDEFLIILPDTPLAGAEQAGGSLTREVAQLRVPTATGIVSPTISIGVAVAGPGESDPMALIARADEALYEAKNAGRNRFVVASPIRAVK